ncbi:MAG TPA: hypothetical protein VHP35_00355 [Terriglobia bacterium]|nr:hypothetical protein [Terriglobia bacterium]
MNAPTASAFRAIGSKGRGANPIASGTKTDKVNPASRRQFEVELTVLAFGSLTSIAGYVMLIGEALSGTEPELSD